MSKIIFPNQFGWLTVIRVLFCHSVGVVRVWSKLERITKDGGKVHFRLPDEEAAPGRGGANREL